MEMGMERLGVVQDKDLVLEVFTKRKTEQDPSYLIVTVKFLGAVWKERNNRVFRGVQSQIPIKTLLTNTLQDVEAFPNPRSSDQTWRKLTQARNIVQLWILTWGRWLTPLAALENLHTEDNGGPNSTSGGRVSAADEEDPTRTGNECRGEAATTAAAPRVGNSD
ncbi:hypothetical protein R1sor_016135 [Riccia sorocarpa]|uniref:Uncharacterized protein n=1 Tax=Riccia sorocarpa TaxID=122646 RepID=A0ABD3HG54_9MARC